MSLIANLTVQYYYSPVYPFFYIYAYVIKDLCIPTNTQTSLHTHAYLWHPINSTVGRVW